MRLKFRQSISDDNHFDQWWWRVANSSKSDHRGGRTMMEKRPWLQNKHVGCFVELVDDKAVWKQLFLHNFFHSGHRLHRFEIHRAQKIKSWRSFWCRCGLLNSEFTREKSPFRLILEAINTSRKAIQLCLYQMWLISMGTEMLSKWKAVVPIYAKFELGRNRPLVVVLRLTW